MTNCGNKICLKISLAIEHDLKVFSLEQKCHIFVHIISLLFFYFVWTSRENWGPHSVVGFSKRTYLPQKDTDRMTKFSMSSVIRLIISSVSTIPLGSSSPHVDAVGYLVEPSLGVKKNPSISSSSVMVISLEQKCHTSVHTISLLFFLYRLLYVDESWEVRSSFMATSMSDRPRCGYRLSRSVTIFSLKQKCAHNCCYFS